MLLSTDTRRVPRDIQPTGWTLSTNPGALERSTVHGWRGAGAEQGGGLVRSRTSASFASFFSFSCSGFRGNRKFGPLWHPALGCPGCHPHQPLRAEEPGETCQKRCGFPGGTWTLGPAQLPARRRSRVGHKTFLFRSVHICPPRCGDVDSMTMGT